MQMVDAPNPVLPDPTAGKVVLHGVHYIITVCQVSAAVGIFTL